MSEEIFIPINKRKMILMTIVYSVLGAGSFLVTYYLGENQEWVTPTVFKAASVVILLFFIIVAGTFAKNIKNGEAGLKISRSGIDDQTSSISSGIIPWKDITGISSVKTASSKLILISVKKPQKYIDNAKNTAIKRLLNQNMTLYKTPVVINTGALIQPLGEVEAAILKFGGRFGIKKK